MIQGDRGVDHAFKLRHHLYYRCNEEDVVGDRLIGTRLRCEGVSVNWSKYSKPWDVIFDYPDHGIARFVVRSLPKELPQQQPSGKPVDPHSFLPHREPIKTNYSHSEIWPYRENIRLKRLSSKIVRKEFQTMMADRSLVLRGPNV
jgi:hypothetical protein